jgi:DNA-binding transcriptional LysR family regulator
MDVARLRVLVEVAHAGSIAAAAQRMAFTPSALSQQLAKLEREVGSQLLDRGPAGVRLTATGEVLVRHGERVIGELRDAEVAVAAAAGRAPQRLAIGTFATAGKTLVPGALAALRRRHPGADLSLLDLEPPAGYGLVTSRDLDVLITHRYPGVALPDAVGLHRQRLLVDRLRLTMPASHPRAGGRIRLRELLDEQWISGARGVPNRTCLQSLAGDLIVHVAYETSDYEVILELVAAGLGIALVPASILAGRRDDRIAVGDLSGVRAAREIYLVHRKRPTPLVADFISLLQPAS